jgi:hypothetical protein
MLIIGLHHWFTQRLGSGWGLWFFEDGGVGGLRHSLNFFSNDLGFSSSFLCYASITKLLPEC